MLFTLQILGALKNDYFQDPSRRMLEGVFKRVLRAFLSNIEAYPPEAGDSLQQWFCEFFINRPDVIDNLLFYPGVYGQHIVFLEGTMPPAQGQTEGLPFKDCFDKNVQALTEINSTTTYDHRYSEHSHKAFFLRSLIEILFNSSIPDQNTYWHGSVLFDLGFSKDLSAASITIPDGLPISTTKELWQYAGVTHWNAWEEFQQLLALDKLVIKAAYNAALTEERNNNILY